MLHSVGCSQPNATVFVNLWNKSSYSSACVHGFIDANTGDVYQTLPWDHRAWHCGSGARGSGNNTHIGVEMCEPATIKYTGGASFVCTDIANARAATERTYKSAVELFAFLCKRFNLNPLADGVIISHHEGCLRGIASNHGDPEHLWNQLGIGYTMDGFRKDVAAAIGGNSDITITDNVEVTPLNGVATISYNGDVNVRTVPDYSAPAITTYPNGKSVNVIGITKDEEFYKLDNGYYLTTNKNYVSFKEADEEESEMRYNSIASMPSYAQPTIIKLVDKKFLTGSGSPEKDENGRPTDLNISQDMMRTFVILDRAGVFDK